jgi:hypothetical protein
MCYILSLYLSISLSLAHCVVGELIVAAFQADTDGEREGEGEGGGDK